MRWAPPVTKITVAKEIAVIVTADAEHRNLMQFYTYFFYGKVRKH